MIIINYLKPDIVIYADSLISGDLNLFDENDRSIFSRKIIAQSIINIPMKLDKVNKIKVILKTKEQLIQKTFTLTKNKNKVQAKQ